MGSHRKEKEDTGSYNYRMFNFFNRKYKITELTPAADILEAFTKFADRSAHMSSAQFRRFLVLHQGHLDCTLPEAERIIDEVIRRRHHLTRSPDTVV
ncbi:phosphoinositide phospholipase C 6 isoform X2 [Tripterygium wilfordii]|uniref:Phosphoinositide phospholipase C 6 isoform X2 n=2 Tax=Tripterygium wilfordii TaxID=458696 RepID=A0A7J7CWI4_TRIWF|nr:phosphoinositide phospholipase C 6 isoform X2 [Tripterygium wilfordii]